MLYRFGASLLPPLKRYEIQDVTGNLVPKKSALRRPHKMQNLIKGVKTRPVTVPGSTQSTFNPLTTSGFPLDVANDKPVWKGLYLKNNEAYERTPSVNLERAYDIVDYVGGRNARERVFNVFEVQQHL